jgi:hypothetical protein
MPYPTFRRIKVVISVGIVVLLGAGCSASTTSSGGPPSRSTVAIPDGWKTYTYGKAQISVPGDWAIMSNYLCAGLSSSGTLYLGPPKGPPYASCPSDSGQGDSVLVTPMPAGTNDQSQCTIKINGLRVYFGPCGSSNAAGIVFYDIPSLGIRAVGMGGTSENVTGPGTGTVVGQVLHTLRPR